MEQQQQPPGLQVQTMQVGTAIQPGYSSTQGYVTTPGYTVHATPSVTTTRTVVQQQPPAVLVTPGFMFGELPVNMPCSACKTQIVTATEYVPGTFSWLACCGLSAIGCVFGCCLIPFCIDECKDVTHYCPNCKVILGIYRRL